MIKVFFLLISSGFFTFLAAAILFTIYRRKIILDTRVEQYFYVEDIDNDKYDPIKSKKVKIQFGILKTYWDIGVQQISKRITKAEKKKMDIILREAGNPFKLSAIEFRLFQLILSIGSGALGLILILPMAEKKSFAWLLAFAISFLGFRIPMFLLAKKRTQRIKEINKSMPDFFDMVNVLLEAGMGLDGAISEVAHQTKGPLGAEFVITLEDMKLGKSRREAFYDLRKRVPSDSFQSIMNSMIQADHLGIGMAKVLRSLTGRIREQRREAAREQAMKAPVKMLFPMVIFIFPALFIVILGPVVIQLITKGLGG
ncbi:MAG: pilus assembly protein TadC [Neobacillus sp.]|nr:pilus assembly protein TadC [Neobacillus sp.]